MLVVFLRGVNFGLWSLLGYSGQNATFRVEREEIKIFIAPAGFLAPEGQKPEEAP